MLRHEISIKHPKPKTAEFTYVRSCGEMYVRESDIDSFLKEASWDYVWMYLGDTVYLSVEVDNLVRKLSQNLSKINVYNMGTGELDFIDIGDRVLYLPDATLKIDLDLTTA
jgi:hypothetical protein